MLVSGTIPWHIGLGVGPCSVVCTVLSLRVRCLVYRWVPLVPSVVPLLVRVPPVSLLIVRPSIP